MPFALLTTTCCNYDRSVRTSSWSSKRDRADAMRRARARDESVGPLDSGVFFAGELSSPVAKCSICQNRVIANTHIHTHHTHWGRQTISCRATQLRRGRTPLPPGAGCLLVCRLSALPSVADHVWPRVCTKPLRVEVVSRTIGPLHPHRLPQRRRHCLNPLRPEGRRGLLSHPWACRQEEVTGRSGEVLFFF